MNMPRFTADASLHKSSNSCQLVGFWADKVDKNMVLPQHKGSHGCRQASDPEECGADWCTTVCTDWDHENCKERPCKPTPPPPPPPPTNCGNHFCPPGHPCCGSGCCPAGTHCCSEFDGCCPDGWSCRSIFGWHFCSPK